MRKSNYALITALYASKTNGLYSDIYFPIIRYALAKKFSEKHDGSTFCSADVISEYINKKFGIKIPTIVIAKSVNKIATSHDPNINLVIYDKGTSFQISKALFQEEELDLDNKEAFFSSKMIEVEAEYQQFIKDQGCHDDKVTFLQFITDNTDEILGYFEDENKNCVDERYTTLVFFLQYLHETNKNLYEVVNQLFWSSIIAAFLKSDKPLIDDSENGIKTEYFLDTSIILGLLDLSNPLRETYSKEVCGIIVNSGGILRVNPITIMEVKYILQSVEQNGPNPLTDIASAYERRNLSANELAKVRLNLDKILSKVHVDTYPAMSPNEQQKIVNEYKGKEITKLLAEFRSKIPVTYTHDNFREIHDVYMDTYIKYRRKERKLNDYVYFLTDNVDLVNFCKVQHNDNNYMLTTGKVILELWMHNAQTVDITNCVLTETMARCLGLHNTNVRYKIIEVSRYYNKTKDNFDSQVYKDFIGHLYRRAKHAIELIDKLTEEVPPSIAQLIKEAANKDTEVYKNSLAKATQSNQTLKQDVLQRDKKLDDINVEVKNLKSQNKSQNETISNLETEKADLTKAIANHKKQLKQANVDLEQIRLEKRNAERINNLYIERDTLIKEIDEIKIELKPLEIERNKAFKNKVPLIYASIGFMFLLLAALLIIIVIINDLKQIIFGFLLAFLVPIAIYCLNRYGVLKDNTEERRKQAYSSWESKNAKYCHLINKIKKIDERINEINNQLNH